MARRTGEIEEFEFIAIGENHNQGVSFDFLLLLDHCNDSFELGLIIYSLCFMLKSLCLALSGCN